MELVLDRKLPKREFFRHWISRNPVLEEDLLLDPEEQEAVYIMRKH